MRTPNSFSTASSSCLSPSGVQVGEIKARTSPSARAASTTCWRYETSAPEGEAAGSELGEPRGAAGCAHAAKSARAAIRLRIEHFTVSPHCRLEQTQQRVLFRVDEQGRVLAPERGIGDLGQDEVGLLLGQQPGG